MKRKVGLLAVVLAVAAFMLVPVTNSFAVSVNPSHLVDTKPTV
jgi:hypothetical protein